MRGFGAKATKIKPMMPITGRNLRARKMVGQLFEQAMRRASPTMGTASWVHFDKSIKAHENACFRTLKQAAYLTWNRARRRLTYAKDTSFHSVPGDPPFRHRKYNSFGLHFIKFRPERKSEFSKHNLEAIVGSEKGKKPASNQRIPGILEHGGNFKADFLPRTKKKQLSRTLLLNLLKQSGGPASARTASRRASKARGRRLTPNEMRRALNGRRLKLNRRIAARPWMVPVAKSVRKELPFIYEAVRKNEWKKYKSDWVAAEKVAARKARNEARARRAKLNQR